jgi:hypothetical protein
MSVHCTLGPVQLDFSSCSAQTITPECSWFMHCPKNCYHSITDRMPPVPSNHPAVGKVPGDIVRVNGGVKDCTQPLIPLTPLHARRFKAWANCRGKTSTKTWVLFPYWLQSSLHAVTHRQSYAVAAVPKRTAETEWGLLLGSAKRMCLSIALKHQPISTWFGGWAAHGVV